MTRRTVKRVSSLTRWALAGWFLIIAAALAVTAWHVAGWLISTAVISGAAYAIGRRQAGSRVLTGKLGANAAYGKRDAVSRYPVSMRRERANGWTAPSRSVLLSAECAAGECVWCHDARCQHDCGHASRDGAPVTRQVWSDRPPF